MAPTTITTVVMIVFALFLLSWATRDLFGSWEPQPRRLTPHQQLEAEFQVAVSEMRRAIEEYERGERRP